jgi:hypothetical protein
VFVPATWLVIPASYSLLQGDERFFLSETVKAEEALFKLQPELASAGALKIKGSDFCEALEQFEKKTLPSRQSKVGVLYMQGAQAEEDQWYSNLGHSIEFDDFLNWLGERVPLKGWSKFRGGLNTTGASCSPCFRAL